MRSQLLTLLASVGLTGFAMANAADVPTVAASAPAANQPAIWTPRRLEHFAHPMVIDSENGWWKMASCDQQYRDMRAVLLRLGARESDLNVDQRACNSGGPQTSLDATFSVLAPASPTGNNAGGEIVAGHWRTLALSGDCAFLEYITKKVLPLFSIRDAKLISTPDCKKLGGIGLYAKILQP